MDNKKFEALIDLIINENEDQARALFHDIVVEKSLEIYESMMDDESVEEGLGGQVGDMMDEISSEESGVLEGDEEESFDDLDIDDGDEVVDIDADEFDGEEGEGVEDRLVSIEDKLDQLMAEFEEIMGNDEEGEEGEEFGGEDEEGEEGEEGEEEFGSEDEAMMEAINLKQVPGLYGTKIGGDNGANSKSIALKDPKVKVAGVAPVKFSGDSESVPTGPKNPSNYGTKGETQVKDATKWKNIPGEDAGKTSFKEKASRDFGKKDSSTGKLVGDDGSVAQNNKSVVEGRRTTKKRI